MSESHVIHIHKYEGVTEESHAKMSRTQRDVKESHTISKDLKSNYLNRIDRWISNRQNYLNTHRIILNNTEVEGSCS